MDIRETAITALAVGLVAIGARTGQAQDEVRDFARKPILVVETDGHHAPVRSLVWQDDDTLLSGGEDKVVKVWELAEGASPSRSVRPVIWRGLRGTVYAMAVTARPDDQGQSLLAVGGVGVETAGGDLTVFRMPGLTRSPSGDVVKRLVRPPGNVGQTIAHTNVVTSLAFNPAGTILASASADRTIILWDVTRDFTPLRVLSGHNGPVRAVAFNPDGSRLASVGADGRIMLWDVAQGRAADSLQTRVAINTVAYTPDGQFIVVGAENGALIRLATAGLNQNPASLRAPDQKPVEAVACDPTGRFLAVSVKSEAGNAADPMTIGCDVELRALPDGNVVQSWPRVHGLVRALAFSPDGARLAYSGGPAQSVYVREMAALAAPARELKGKGSTPFDLGFSKDSRTVGFTREPFAAGNPPAVYDGFDMVRRAALRVPRDQLAGAIKEQAGWSLRTIPNPYSLEAVNADGRRLPLFIDPVTERHWWSSTFVPPGPGHPRPVVAVGTDSGIAVFELQNGARTRVYTGHSAPVVSLAPSPDGRWLASSSQDQTVMLYPLAGCDTRPALGASFRQRADGLWTVAAVERRSFATAMGLERGDVITQAGIGRQVFTRPEEIARFVAAVDQEAPGLNQIGIRVRRIVAVPIPGAVPLELVLPTTKRDNAAFTIMLDADNEWVTWTPQGYYDTSIAGDTQLLGWHINPPYRITRPTDFVPVITYAASMNRPDVLDRLWRTGDLEQALAPPPPPPPPAPAPAPVVQPPPRPVAPVVRAAPPPRVIPPDVQAAMNQPPRITFATIVGQEPVPAPGVLWKVSRARPRLSVKIAADTGKPAIRDRKIIFDEQPHPMNALGQPTDSLSEDIELDLTPNRRVRLAVEAVSVNDKRRVETLDLIYVQPPPPLPPPPRLFLLGIGTDQLDDPRLPAVRFAGQDARDLASFLGEHLVSTSATVPRVHESHILTGAGASAGSITGALDRLNELVQKKEVNKGDVVAVAIAAHVLNLEQSMVVAAADSQVGPPAKAVVPTRSLCDVLGHLTDYGCRVIVFLDGVHQVDEKLAARIKPMVRDLYQKRGVITFVASKEGPSDVDVPSGHGVFALGLLRVFQQAGAGGNRAEVYTLDQFKTAMRDAILNLSERRQDAACYIPLQVPEQTLFAKP